MNDKTRQIIVLITAVIQVAVNTLIGSGIYDFGLPSTEAISDSLPNYFTPAGYTFLVWNIIFLGIIAYAFYQMLPTQTERPIHRQIGNWVILANIGNGIWSLVWGMGGVKGSESYQPAFHILSGFIIVGILFSLTMIFIRLREFQPQLTTSDKWLIQAPYSAFFAWINIATVANITAVLVSLDVQAGEAGAFWSAVMVTIATGLASGLILYNRGLIGTVAFAVVIVWAFVGVAAGNADQSNLVGIVSGIGAVIVVAITLFCVTNNPDQRELIGIRSPS